MEQNSTLFQKDGKCETWQDMRLVTELANDIYVNGVRTCKQMKF